MHTPAKTFVRAQALRKAMTRTEVALWERVRGSRLDGLKFRRQHPLGPYILDFYCVAARLAVEIDGASHQGAQARVRDAQRDAFVREQGIATLRITVGNMIEDMEKAVDAIRAAARKRIDHKGPAYPSAAHEGKADSFNESAITWLAFDSVSPSPASPDLPRRVAWATLGRMVVSAASYQGL
ncbi:MAG: hypothetical protein JWP35_871 [Caulobacter sp.]|nr:hypothetical protein [Caulobacter sp.]